MVLFACFITCFECMLSFGLFWFYFLACLLCTNMPRPTAIKFLYFKTLLDNKSLLTENALCGFMLFSGAQYNLDNLKEDFLVLITRLPPVAGADVAFCDT